MRHSLLTVALTGLFLVVGQLAPAADHVMALRIASLDAMLADGERIAEGMDQVVLGNAHSYGGPIELTPAASPQDGVLDVMCLAQPEPLQMAEMVSYGFLRATPRCPHVLYCRARQAVLSSARAEVPYQLDGEAAGFLPVEVELLRAAVRMLVPAGYRARRRGLPQEDRVPEA